MVTVGELVCFEGMPTGRLGTGSAFAKASGDSDVRFQLSANALDLSTFLLKSVCYRQFNTVRVQLELPEATRISRPEGQPLPFGQSKESASPRSASSSHLSLMP